MSRTHYVVPDGITAPATVPEGSGGAVEVQVHNGTEIIVEVSTTGERVTVPVDDDGTARFELPASAVAGSRLIIIDADDPGSSAEVSVVPASSAP